MWKINVISWHEEEEDNHYIASVEDSHSSEPQNILVVSF